MKKLIFLLLTTSSVYAGGIGSGVTLSPPIYQTGGNGGSTNAAFATNSTYAATATNGVSGVFVVSNGVSLKMPSLDFAVVFASNNYPILVGAGSYNFTNSITNSIVIKGQAPFISTLIWWGTNASAAGYPPIHLCDNDVLQSFDIELAPTNTPTGQYFLTNNTAIIGTAGFGTTPTFNNIDIENVSSTNDASDGFYFTVENSTNGLLRNINFSGMWDNFINFSGTMKNWIVDGFSFNALNGNQNLGHNLYIFGSGSSIIFRNGYMYVSATNGYNLQTANGCGAITFQNCIFTNSPLSGTTPTNIFFNTASTSGGALTLFNCLIPPSGIVLRTAANPPIFSMSTFPVTNLLSAGFLRTDGTNTFSSLDGTTLTNLNTNNFTITANPTNSIVVATTYTNANVRSWLVGSAYLASGVSGNANITCNYTNNGIGYTSQMQIGLGVSMADYIPFCIPIDPLGTYRFVATAGTGATAYITNTVQVQYPP